MYLRYELLVQLETQKLNLYFEDFLIFLKNCIVKFDILFFEKYWTIPGNIYICKQVKFVSLAKKNSLVHINDALEDN